MLQPKVFRKTTSVDEDPFYGSENVATDNFA